MPYSPASPRSPSSSQIRSRNRSSAPPGFLSLKPKPRPIAQLSIRELHDLHIRNTKILASPYASHSLFGFSVANFAPPLSSGASTSTYVQRISSEQTAIEARLIELEGVDSIQTTLRNTRIYGEDDMNIDPTPEPPVSRTLTAKQRALARYVCFLIYLFSLLLITIHHQAPINCTGTTASLSLQEAIALEQRAHAIDEERKQRVIERKKRLGLPIPGEVLTREQREARIWAFMSAVWNFSSYLWELMYQSQRNHKPTDSDLEDDDDDEDLDGEDEDPANWFEDDQDDGRKGQNIVEPDAEEPSPTIRIDSYGAHYSNFFEP